MTHSQAIAESPPPPRPAPQSPLSEQSQKVAEEAFSKSETSQMCSKFLISCLRWNGNQRVHNRSSMYSPPPPSLVVRDVIMGYVDDILGDKIITEVKK